MPARPGGRVWPPLPRPPGPPPAAKPAYKICAASKSEEKAWRDLIASHGGKLRHYYDYLSQTPQKPDGERVFPMKGKKMAGVWECEVGGGARLFYTVDEQQKSVLIREVRTAHD